MAGEIPNAESVETAIGAARTKDLSRLAIVREVLGNLDQDARVVAIQGFISAEPDFFDNPAVINGASDLLLEIFGERGKHSRIAVGVAALPLNATVEISLVVEAA